MAGGRHGRRGAVALLGAADMGLSSGCRVAAAFRTARRLACRSASHCPTMAHLRMVPVVTLVGIFLPGCLAIPLDKQRPPASQEPDAVGRRSPGNTGRSVASAMARIR